MGISSSQDVYIMTNEELGNLLTQISTEIKSLVTTKELSEAKELLTKNLADSKEALQRELRDLEEKHSKRLGNVEKKSEGFGVWIKVHTWVLATVAASVIGVIVKVVLG